MALHSLSSAKRMCKRADWQITNLILQKIMYLAQMYHLGIYKTPLVDGNFEAWDYGPVHPVVYHHVKVFGAVPVGNIFGTIQSIAEEGTETNLLDQAVDQLKGYSSGKLVEITHRDYGAWANYYVPRNSIRIPNDEIEKEYHELQRRRGI